jgi:hypothetical protein
MGVAAQESISISGGWARGRAIPGSASLPFFGHPFPNGVFRQQGMEFQNKNMAKRTKPCISLTQIQYSRLPQIFQIYVDSFPVLLAPGSLERIFYLTYNMQTVIQPGTLKQ